MVADPNVVEWGALVIVEPHPEFPSPETERAEVTRAAGRPVYHKGKGVYFLPFMENGEALQVLSERGFNAKLVVDQ